MSQYILASINFELSDYRFSLLFAKQRYFAESPRLIISAACLTVTIDIFLLKKNIVGKHLEMFIEKRGDDKRKNSTGLTSEKCNFRYRRSASRRRARDITREYGIRRRANTTQYGQFLLKHF